MTGSRQAVFRDEGLPIAAIARDGRLTFLTTEDFDRAWELGIFCLKVPEHLDLDGARQFGSELLARNSPYRSIQQYGALEGFIALKNNQQTKQKRSYSDMACRRAVMAIKNTFTARYHRRRIVSGIWMGAAMAKRAATT